MLFLVTLQALKPSNVKEGSDNPRRSGLLASRPPRMHSWMLPAEITILASENGRSWSRVSVFIAIIYKDARSALWNWISTLQNVLEYQISIYTYIYILIISGYTYIYNIWMGMQLLLFRTYVTCIFFFFASAASLVRVGRTRFADDILKHSLWQGGFGHPIQTWYNINTSLTTHITVQYNNMDYYDTGALILTLLGPWP